LGKFLQNVHGFRRSALWCGGCASGSNLDAALALLEGVTFVGEGVYYFLDQFIWCVLADDAFDAFVVCCFAPLQACCCCFLCPHHQLATQTPRLPSAPKKTNTTTNQTG
jgi:hypothetical protein